MIYEKIGLLGWKRAWERVCNLPTRSGESALRRVWSKCLDLLELVDYQKNETKNPNAYLLIVPLYPPIYHI